MSLTFKPSNNKLPTNKPTEKKKATYGIKTVFTKTIELDELSMAAKDEKTGEAHKVEDVYSMEVPLIKINDYVFSRQEIKNIIIDCTGFVPKITLSVAFLHQMFLAKEMPKDGDIISIAIRNQTDVLKIIRNDYIITGVHVVPNYTEVKSPVMMTFYGELFVPGLRGQKDSFSFEGTSYEALQKFAQKYRLGFASNEDNTNDKQIWLKANDTGEDFVKSVTERAWRDNNSFYKSWIDVYYNLNFVNLNKRLISAEESVELATILSNVDKNWNYGTNTGEENTITTAKVFSNFPNFRTSPFFITTWRPINRSSNITFEIGTKIICSMFEHNKNIYENPEGQKYWSVPVEPVYDPEKTNRYIILRGRTSYVKDLDEEGKNKNPELQRANYPYVDLYTKYPWMGIQYTISNPDENSLKWDGNHHRNYQISLLQNIMNNKELDKLNLHIEITGHNFNIINGDKIPVALIRTDAVNNIKINPEMGLMDALDLFYSGWYLVKGFKLSWTSKDEGTPLSKFAQEFILTRREWPPPVPIEPIETNVE